MGESDTHRFIKEKIAEALSELSYKVATESREGGKRLDVKAEKDGDIVNVEVIKSHIPEWLLVRVEGDLRTPKPIQYTVKVQKVGTSLQMVIPKAVADGFEIRQGDEMVLTITGHEIVAKKK